jgi:cytosine/adenosine deaminase-related metal-dependent hydrolase
LLPIAAPPISDGALISERPAPGAPAVIGAVGAAGDLLAGHRGAVRDHGEAVLLPGLVNAHTHLELSALAGRIPRSADLGAWLVAVTEARQQLSAATVATAIDTAIAATTAAGTVLVGEVTNTGVTTQPLAASTLYARVFHEVIGFDPRAAGTVFDAARARLREHEALAAPRLRHALAAHAPYSVSPRLLRLVRGFNAAAGRPSAIHLAESAAEERFLADGSGPLAVMKERFGTALPGWEPPGQASAAYLWRLGWFEHPGLAVHCVELNARGIELLRRSGITACLCPRSNENLGLGVAPASELLAAGVSLALGTDSLAGVDSLSLFDELAAAARLYAGVEPAALIRAATLGGARALGFDEIGSLEPGQVAAVIAVADAGGALADPYEVLLSRPAPAQIEVLDPS